VTIAVVVVRGALHGGSAKSPPPAAHVSAPAKHAAARPRLYTVKAGDTLSAIAGRSGVPLARIQVLIDLGAGDADLSPPPAVIERISEAVRIPTMSRYGFALGLVEYREAVARFMKRRFGQDFHPIKEIVPLIGSKEGISHLAFAYLTKGDYAILPEPGYSSYVGGTLLAEATPYKYLLRLENGFLIDLDTVCSLSYTSVAADDLPCVDLCGRRIIKKKIISPPEERLVISTTITSQAT